MTASTASPTQLSATLKPAYETNSLSLSSIHDDFESMKLKPWHAELLFKGHLCFSTDYNIPADESAFETEHDLFALTAREHKGFILRFHPAKYPPNVGPFDRHNSSFSLLRRELCQLCSKHCGFNMISNGFDKQYATQYATLRCSRFKFSKQNLDKLAPGQLRVHSLTRDKSNQRKGKRKREGLSFKRGTSTSRPVREQGDVACKCQLRFGLDQHSLFLLCGVGNREHQGHLPLERHERSAQFSHLPEDVKLLARQCAACGIRAGASARLLKNALGINVTTRQVARHTQSSKLALLIAGQTVYEAERETSSDVDIITDYFKETKQIYTALYHRKPPGRDNSSKDDVLWNESGALGSDPAGEAFEFTGPGEVNGDIMKYAVDTRESVGASNEQDVLVALVWLSPRQKQIFGAFPEQLSIDGTHKTQREGWELITLSVNDMSGKPEVVLKCWAPNNRAWLFKWLFTVALPALVGISTCQKVQLVLTDGDSQECSQLDCALVDVFTNAVRRRCGWHIVDRGWFRSLPANLGIMKQDPKFKEVVDLIGLVKGWLYSLMKDIETEKEYKM